ncbi:hypothetical protein Leryth_010734 [Lithospermum erythrorhizon]|nr:hypothetical protein Leryth_010734 [Lithospermum erythrorhizon]
MVIYICGALWWNSHFQHETQNYLPSYLRRELPKGIRRVTAVTLDSAIKAAELASTLEQEVDEASKMEGSLLEQKVTSLNGRVEAAAIPAAKKADLKSKFSALQSQVIKYKKKIAEENMQKAVKVATEMAQVNVGADTAAVREAVVKVMEKGMPTLVVSVDETGSKVLVCAGVPEKNDSCKQLKVREWLDATLKPLKGKGGGGKGGIAQGQGSDSTHVGDAMDVAMSFAKMKLS